MRRRRGLTHGEDYIGDDDINGDPEHQHRGRQHSRRTTHTPRSIQWRRFLLNGGSLGRSPQRGPGAEPLVRGSEGHSPPPEAEKKLNLDNTKPL